MELSAELLKSMLLGIKTEQGKGAAELRRNPRVSIRYTVKIAPYTNGTLGHAIRVWTRDISPGGLGILHNIKMEVGSRFIVLLPRDKGKPLLLLCTVRNCQELSDNLYAIGTSFAEVAGPPGEGKPKQAPAAVPAGFAPAVPSGADSQLLTEEIQRISRAILA